MYAMAVGEFVMLAAALWLIRDAIDRYMIGDLVRGLVAGGATVALMRWPGPFAPFLAIPICVLLFLGLSAAIGLVNRSDIDVLLSGLRKRSPKAVQSAAES